MNLEILEDIGLTRSEILVYVALTELGSSTTGKIVEKSGASSSKIYEILDKLMNKGLVSFIIQSGVKYFEAAPPARLLDYMKEREQHMHEQKETLKTLLPELELKRKMSSHTIEATIFKGLKGGETAFRILIDAMKKEDEWLGYIIWFTNRRHFDLLTKLHWYRAKKGLKSRLIFNAKEREDGSTREKIPHTKVKYMQSNDKNPTIINVAGDITLINIMAEEIMVFMIKNKDVANTFRNQFERLWNQQSQSYEGQENVQFLYEDLVNQAHKHDEVLIFAAKPSTKEGADFNVGWNKRISEKTKGVRLLYYGDTQKNRERAEEMKAQGCYAKIITTDQKSPISTVVSGNVVINTIWGANPLSFKIENKTVADSLRTNFDLLWKQDIKVLRGLDAIQGIFEDMLNYKEAAFIGARGYFIDIRPDFADDWEARASKQQFRLRNIVDIEVKGHRITQFPFVETRYNIPKEFSTLSVFWIYGNKIAISNWVEQEPLVVIIENKQIHDIYKKQFELLWDPEVRSLKGYKGVIEMCEDVLKSREDLYFLGANGLIEVTHPEYFKKFSQTCKQHGIRFHILANEDIRGKRFKNIDSSKIKYLPMISSPVTIWIFKDKVAHILAKDPQIITLIHNQDLADSYRAHFKRLWNEIAVP